MVDYLERRRNTPSASLGESRVLCTMKVQIHKAILSAGAIRVYISFKKINFLPTNVAIYSLAFATQKNLFNSANSVTKAEAPRI
jgi:hypothetical protein